MDWIYIESPAASGTVAIKCITPRYGVDTPKWLHTKYPQRKIDWKVLLVAMKNVTSKYDLDVLVRMDMNYPKRKIDWPTMMWMRPTE